MNISESARAVCPFYQTYRDREIQCESCVKRTRLLLVFRNKTEAIRHKRSFCDTYEWGECPNAKHRLDED